MAYTKTVWKDEIVQHPKRFTATENDDDTLTLEPAFGTTLQEGTPVNAANLNKIEEGIASTTQDIANITETYEPVNKFDSESALDNSMFSIRTYTDGRPNTLNKIATSTSYNYFITVYIPAVSGDVIMSNYGMYSIAFYSDANGTLSADGNGNQAIYLSNATQLEITGSGVAYIRICYNQMTRKQTLMVTRNASIPSSYTPYVAPKTVIKYNAISQYVRKRIDIKSTDSAEAVINTMISAYQTANCDVYFETAVYDLSSKIAKIETDYGMTYCEIPIGAGCRYYFNGSTVTATLNEENTEFYANLLGCMRVPNSYELYDGVLIATGTRYVVHDECSAMDGTYIHRYHNMVLDYRSGNRTETIRKALGGGTGKHGVIDIDGCVFLTDGTDSCASFHGNASDVGTSDFNVTVKNSYFQNSFRLADLANNQTGRVVSSNNKYGSSLIVLGDKWTVTAFGDVNG